MADTLFELRRRTFDTPHFRGVEFIEVESKSILNKVPGNRLPFNWTINPYRGCTHACSYCTGGDTPVLMADGRSKNIRDVRKGDRIYGTVRRGNYRRYEVTEVLDHWETQKRAHRVTLEDGTELVTSGDHRFLTRRGWKHVTGSEHGSDRRPHLTLNNELLGTGQMARASEHDAEYIRGYLTGMIRGDGAVGTYEARRGNGTSFLAHRFRLALVDIEGLTRTRNFLQTIEVPTSEFLFSTGTDARKPVHAIRTQTERGVGRIQEVVAWPERPSLQWAKGFLAGIFDAEGSYNRGILRISNCDPLLVRHVETSLRRLGLFYVRETQKGTNKPVLVTRIIGGLQAHLRFMQTVDPAITRKRSIEGQAIKNDARLKVVSIEDTGVEMPMYDITTGTGDFIADGVVSHNCFARATHTFLDMDAGRDFETKIVVKVNAGQLLKKELRAKRWKGESVALGTNTDPYQRCEGKYKLMPQIIEAFTEVRNPFTILTKGTLILRDLELLREAAAHSEVTTAFSIGTLDEDVWNKSEPGTPHPRKRVDAVRRLNEAGIPCGVLVAPVLPGISDSEAQLREVITACIDAGATHVSPILLHLRPKVREVYMEWLAAEYPDLVPRYTEMYPKAYAATADRSQLQQRSRAIIDAHPRKKELRRRALPKPKAAPKPASEQLSLM